MCCRNWWYYVRKLNTERAPQQHYFFFLSLNKSNGNKMQKKGAKEPQICKEHVVWGHVKDKMFNVRIFHRFPRCVLCILYTFMVGLCLYVCVNEHRKKWCRLLKMYLIIYSFIGRKREKIKYKTFILHFERSIAIYRMASDRVCNIDLSQCQNTLWTRIHERWTRSNRNHSTIKMRAKQEKNIYSKTTTTTSAMY